ncbi:ATP-binding protein [Zoogloea sp.]|uniref:sensor histidine kinase n=1 Tax=Zoogloea sp. TaxID=49181 RepID=UPI001416044A|nr:MAG: HAMP domain-containing protein [Zoogloea sp.]
MDLTRLLMRRAAWIFLASLSVAVVLASWRASTDIRQENHGAREVARLLEALSGLQRGNAGSLPQDLAVLQAISQSEALRHLTFQIEDGQGQVLVPAAHPIRTGEGGARLVLRRDDGQTFNAVLVPDPLSEQREAVADILGMTGMFLVYGLAMLLGSYWVVRRAFGPLRAILGAIAAFRRQDFSARLPRLPVRELDHVAGALNHLAEALGAAEARQKQLSVRLMTLQEDERAQLALSLQEHLGQALTALRANVAYLLRRTAADVSLQAAVRDMEAQALTLHQSLRGLLHQLQPVAGVQGAGDRLPIRGLLEELVKSWQDARLPGRDFRLSIHPGDLELPRETSLFVYRMTQEALANIARHADARTIRIELQVDAGDPAALNWSVCDDGVGILAPEAAIRHGNGLAGLRERIWALGGQLEVSPLAPGQARPGLRLAARLPLGRAG